MSFPAYLDLAQLRIWTETELKLRDLAQNTLVDCVTTTLKDVNRAWDFSRVEAPAILPRSLMSEEYSNDDIWMTQVERASQPFALRAETTPTTYAAIRHFYPNLKHLKPPRGFWQVGKSYRQEPASKATRLRFFEFTQLEFQCLYSPETKADYRAKLMPVLAQKMGWLCQSEVRIVDSERLPAYSQSTLDIEVQHLGEWREVASVSLRTDFDDNLLNLEVAMGLDRVMVIGSEMS
jgi:glycyl-tRNA synthetase